jgi:hypothetical protein
MSVIVCAFAVMSVAIVYSNWRSHHQATENQQKQLRNRVAYLLWVMANRLPEPK